MDLEYCKGCGICVEVCPSKAIVMEPENVEQPALTVEGTCCDV
ncbi:MAG TPA: 4Fe-4S binding protein [Candidatus Hydrogenedentes bacterium]|nr:4Fe-4S binding protein [Candidatus Hydrogenedentota bacterium]